MCVFDFVSLSLFCGDYPERQDLYYQHSMNMEGCLGSHGRMWASLNVLKFSWGSCDTFECKIKASGL